MHMMLVDRHVGSPSYLIVMAQFARRSPQGTDNAEDSYLRVALRPAHTSFSIRNGLRGRVLLALLAPLDWLATECIGIRWIFSDILPKHPAYEHRCGPRVHFQVRHKIEIMLPVFRRHLFHLQASEPFVGHLWFPGHSRSLCVCDSRLQIHLSPQPDSDRQ